MGVNAADDREIRWGAAEGNAQNILQGQQLNEQGRANRAQEDIERRRISQSSVNVLLGSLAGLLAVAYATCCQMILLTIA